MAALLMSMLRCWSNRYRFRSNPGRLTNSGTQWQIGFYARKNWLFAENTSDATTTGDNDRLPGVTGGSDQQVTKKRDAKPNPNEQIALIA